MCFALIGAMLASICGCGADTNSYAGGNPWINSDIEENVKNNYDTELKDDFALAVNKDWILNNSLKDGDASEEYLISYQWRLQNKLIAILQCIS